MFLIVKKLWLLIRCSCFQSSGAIALCAMVRQLCGHLMTIFGRSETVYAFRYPPLCYFVAIRLNKARRYQRKISKFIKLRSIP